MTASSHAVIGAAIVTKIPDWRISIPLILLSHILGDIPNHWDTGTGWKDKKMSKVFADTVIDELAGFFVVAVIFIWGLHQNPVTILTGVIVSQFLDLIEIPYFFLGWKSVPWSWVNDFTHLFHKKLPQIHLSLTTQILISVAFILWCLI